MPVRSVHFPAPLMLVPAKDLLAKLAALKGNGSPRSPYDIQRDLNEVNALGGVPGTLHKPWRAGADWSLRVYTRRYAVRLFATKRGDAYTIASAELLRLTDHQQLASACLLLRPRGWQVALTNRDVPQGTVSHWQLIAAQWISLLSSMTVTAAADGRQAAFLDTVDRVIDAARQLKASDEDGHRYPYRQVASAAGARAGTTQRYDFTLTGTRPLEDGARVLVAPIAPMAADRQDPQTDARGGRPTAARGRVSRSSGMTVTIDFDEPVSWTDLKGQGEITLAPSDFIYRLEHEAVARFRSGHARNPGLLAALVEGRVEGTAEGSASVPYGASPSAPLAGRPARRLNPEQLKVFDEALAGPGLLAVIGPPGTGKTRTIAEIARAVAVRGQRVLVCSQSNRAVDNVLPRLPGELLAIRVGSDAVTAEGIPYLLDRQAAELREQALNIARRNLAAYRPLADAGAWAGELARALAALAGLRADLAQAQARHADARRAVGGPLTREVDEAGEAAAALAAGAKRGFEQAERLRRKSESGFALLASRRARRSAAAEGGAAAAILALRDAEAAHAAARQRLAEMTKDAPAVLDAAAEVHALRAQAEREHAAALRAARAAGELVLAMGVEQPAVREHDFDLDCANASLAAAQAALRQWLPWLQARQELLTRWVGEAAGESEQLHPELIRYADVLAATCIGAGSKAELADLDIDLAIVDEAGQIGVADILIPLGRARRAVMVGDHLQLPPFLAGEVREWGARAGDPGVRDVLTKSALELVVDALPPDSPNVVWLTEQWRMPAEIADFVSAQFYGGRLRTPPGNNREHRDALFRSVLAFVDTSARDPAERRERSGRSRERWGQQGYDNPLEARLLASLAVHYDRLHRDWAVIVPYRAQAELIRNQLAGHAGSAEQIFLNVGTVDSFQGGERDVILYGFTRSNPRGEVGFLRELRRLNVAVTRSRQQLVLVGDLATLTSARDDGFRHLATALRAHVARHGELVPADVAASRLAATR